MRVGVEEAVLEDYLQVNAGRPFGQLPAVDAGLLQCLDVADLDPPDAFQRQDARGARLPENFWNVDVWIAVEILGEALRAAALPDVVQLRPQGLGELLREPDYVVVFGHLPATTRRGSLVLQYLQVLLDLLDYAGPPHLDHDLGAVRERGGVSLPDRSGGERRGIEVREDHLRGLPSSASMVCSTYSGGTAGAAS